MRQINISPWKSIYLFTKYDHHTLINYATLITQSNNGDYFYLLDDMDKIIDVSLMPEYIKEDWLNYNKKELSISILNSSIKECQADYNKYHEYHSNFSHFEKQLNLLISLRRDLILKGIT